MEINIETVNEAYQKVLKATEDVQNIALSLFKVKENLEKDVLNAVANGSIQGKNQQERDAATLQMFEPAYQVKAEKEVGLEEAKNTLALARIELDCLRDCIRILELTKA